MFSPTFHISNKAYASSIKRDREREAEQATNETSQECFTGRRSYVRGDDRFCSPRCRDGFDACLPPFQQQKSRSTYTWLDPALGYSVPNISSWIGNSVFSRCVRYRALGPQIAEDSERLVAGMIRWTFSMSIVTEQFPRLISTIEAANDPLGLTIFYDSL